MISSQFWIYILIIVILLIVLSIFLFLLKYSRRIPLILQSYQQEPNWQKLQNYLPQKYRLNQNNLPKEWYWSWKDGYDIHVDHYPNPQADAKIILLHGVGTNGRQMSLILGHPLAEKGYETFALDLPGYGLTKVPHRSSLNYPEWVNLVNDFIHAEAQKDARPIFLYGLSAGGMLTLHAAAINKYVKGIIGMTFLDQQIYTVQKGTMRFSALSRINLWGLKLFANTPIDQILLPMALVSKMSALTNNKDALDIMLHDPLSAGNRMSLKFLNSYMHYKPSVAVKDFVQCPLLLTQPAEDKWTPLSFSQPVLDQLQVDYKIVMLPSGGHYPIEPEALTVLLESTINFIEKYK